MEYSRHSEASAAPSSSLSSLEVLIQTARAHTLTVLATLTCRERGSLNKKIEQ